jgi:hypothetical protein
MAKKKKSLLKKIGKAAAIAGALYVGAKGLKGGLKGRADKLTEGDIGIGQRAPIVEDAPYITKKKPHFDYKFFAGKKGGRAAAKHGGRIGKQFGGGLGSTARRDMRSGYYPSDMGMRGGTMYKKGGRVKSMGIAKRGGGIAKK